MQQKLPECVNNTFFFYIYFQGEVFIADCSPETLAELGQIIENRPDQYFRVYQTSTGITFARPVEVWDPLSTCQTLSPTDHSVPLGELKLN